MAGSGALWKSPYLALLGDISRAACLLLVRQTYIACLRHVAYAGRCAHRMRSINAGMLTCGLCHAKDKINAGAASTILVIFIC